MTTDDGKYLRLSLSILYCFGSTCLYILTYITFVAFVSELDEDERKQKIKENRQNRSESFLLDFIPKLNIVCTGLVAALMSSELPLLPNSSVFCMSLSETYIVKCVISKFHPLSGIAMTGTLVRAERNVRPDRVTISNSLLLEIFPEKNGGW